MKKAKQVWLSDYMIMGYFALLSLVLHLLAIEGYGYFRDEFYYIACSDHPDFGYVDQPPFSILILKLVRLILGDSRIAIRLLPVLGAAIFIFLTGLMVRELGGKKFAIALASASAFAVTGNFFLFNYYSMNFLDLLFWQVIIIIILRIIKTGNSKYWLLFGVVVGLGLQNKISILFLGFGLAVGLLLTKERKYLKDKYLWFGAAIAGLLFLPYILWNMTHGWATLEFMHNAKVYKMANVSPLEFFFNQVLYNNPLTMVIWLSGLWYFFFNREGKTYRIFGWMYLAIYILFTIQQAKDYYLAPAYPILFAGGAVMFENWLMQRKWLWLKPLLLSLIVIFALILCPIALPILPVEKTVKVAKSFGLTNHAGEKHEVGLLPQHFADMYGWEEIVSKVAEVYNTLSPTEKNECAIYANNYGVTGAINFFGNKFHLPPAFSGHNNYFFWPPKKQTFNVLVIVGGRKEDHERSFREVAEMGRTRCQYCMPYENNNPIYICRGIKRPIEEIWPSVKNFI